MITYFIKINVNGSDNKYLPSIDFTPYATLFFLSRLG